MEKQPRQMQPQAPVLYVSPKSATVAGLLGIFLGQFGAHNWYLGEKKKEAIHLCLLGGGILLVIIATILLFDALKLAMTTTHESDYGYSYTSGTASQAEALDVLIPILYFVGCVAIVGNGIWGLVEGIIILAQGNEGLARKGIPVDAPVAYVQQSLAQQPYAGQPMTQPVSETDGAEETTKTTKASGVEEKTASEK